MHVHRKPLFFPFPFLVLSCLVLSCLVFHCLVLSFVFLSFPLRKHHGLKMYPPKEHPKYFRQGLLVVAVIEIFVVSGCVVMTWIVTTTVWSLATCIYICALVTLHEFS